MLLQTNSYIVPKDKRSEHARLMRRFRLALVKLGCDLFEVYEQVGANWNGADNGGRFVQLMRFRDRKHQTMVQNAERNDTAAQALISEFCELVNFPYQQQQGFFAVGFYTSVLPSPTAKSLENAEAQNEAVDGMADDGEPAFEEVEADEQALGEIDPAAHAGESGRPMDRYEAPLLAEEDSVAEAEMFPDGEILDLDAQGEPLSEEELAQELERETPPVVPPAPRSGLFRRASGK